MAVQHHTSQLTAPAGNALENGAAGIRGRLAPDVPHRRGSQLYDAALMRLRVRMETGDGMGYALGITSCQPRSGVSAFAANLAIRAADLQFGPVLLVDAHPGRSTLARRFGMKNKPGLGDALSGAAHLDDCVHGSAVESLDVMPLGGKGLLERASVEVERIELLVKQLRAEYPLVVFDLPDVPNLMHTLLLGQQLDGLLLAVRAERVRGVEAASALRRLRADGVQVIGSVLTRQRSYLPRWLDRIL